LVEHNPHLNKLAIQYYKKEKEWQFFYDNNFDVMDCPSNSDSRPNSNSQNCKVKGNISNRSEKNTILLLHIPTMDLVSVALKM